MCEQAKQKDKKPPCSYLLADQEAPAHVNSVFDNAPIGCILSYQLNDLKEDAVVFSCNRPLDEVRGKADELKYRGPRSGFLSGGGGGLTRTRKREPSRGVGGHAPPGKFEILFF